ncbi:MAG: DUF2497 domain-containing protein [Devosiaceae bacterium]|nr:DUF2497 domain-containing protein [Devosiaceae bacterium]
MNKPAAKEPSMDEILSSIRQIIADDDVDESSENANEAEKETTVSNKSAEEAELENPAQEAEDALELTSEQIVTDESDNIEFSPTEQNELVLKPEEDLSELVVPDDISFDDEVNEPEPEKISAPAPSLPDPDLSADMAEQLLEPATAAVVSGAFAKLGAFGFDDKDLTIENMIRQMLRPMLKEWLDENLPSIVENTVRKEVERLSRGR